MIISCSAVLFDLDGVSGRFDRVRRAAVARLGGTAGPRGGAVLRVCHGRRAVETIRLAAPELDAEAEVARFPEFVD